MNFLFFKKLFRFLLIGVPVLLIGIFLSCNQVNGSHTYLNVSTDSAWFKYDTVEISWKNPATGNISVLFRGDPKKLPEINHFLADEYDGRIIEVSLTGYSDKEILFKEVWNFDGRDSSPSKKDTIVNKLVQSLTVSFSMPNATITIGDTVDFEAIAVADGGVLRNAAWDFVGNGIYSDSIGLTGTSATVRARHRFDSAGQIMVSLEVQASGDREEKATVWVDVRQDLPVASAGPDTTVYSGSRVFLHGTGKDTLGQILLMEWEIGTGSFIAGSGDTSFLAPEITGDLPCTFRVTDDDGQTAMDKTIVHVVSKSESNLTSLGVSAGSVSSRFNPAVFTYSDTLGNSTETVVITPVGNGVIKVNGLETLSGAASKAISLTPGSNEIVVSVKLDGAAEKSYSLFMVRREASSESDLKSLALSAGVMDKAFNPADTAYGISVGNGTLATTVTATPADASAELSVNGFSVASGSVSGSINLAVGENAIVIVVTAQSGASKNYRIKVVRAASGNSNLTALKASGGEFSPAFSTSILEYSMSVANPTATTDISCTPADPGSGITINGQPAPSGTLPVPLTVGGTTVLVVITASDGSKSTYTLRITRAGDGNSDLSGLSLSTGALTPSFTPEVVFYSASVPNATVWTQVTATVANSASTLTINNADAASTKATGVNLDVGTTPIAIVVKAQNGISKTYTVLVTRAPNANAELSAILLSAGTYAPVFTGGTVDYSLAVANDVTATTVTPTPAAVTSSITVNGADVAAGSASKPISLAVGANTISVSVTAQSGGIKNYSFAITRAPNSDASLSSLKASAGALTPTFASGDTAYTLGVGNAVLSTTLTPTVTASTSKVEVNNTENVSGSASAEIGLKVGANPLKIVVTAQSGAKRTYMVTITRAANPDADLKSLVFSAVDLSPVFAPGVASYTFSVPNSVDKTTITPTANALESKLTLNKPVATPITSGSTSAPINLNVGANTLSVLVTAENGSTKTYAVTIMRAMNGDATLFDLKTSGGDVLPAFDPAKDAYTLAVDNSVGTLTVTPTVTVATSTLVVKIEAIASGSASSPITLNLGANIIPIVVTAQSGAKKTYTLTVTRASNGIADLAGLETSTGNLIPVFGAGVTSYSVAVDYPVLNTTLKATLAAPSTSTLAINSKVASSGVFTGSISLNVGDNAIPVKVTAENGTSKTYTVTFRRSANPDNALSNLSVTAMATGGPTSNRTLIPAFSSATLTYITSPIVSGSTVKVKATTSDPGATLKINGQAVASGFESGSIALLTTGPTSISIEVTAADASVKTYMLKVARPQDVGYAVGYNGAVIKSLDAGLTWTSATKPSADPLSSPWFFNTDTGFVLGANKNIWKTTDGAVTWKQVATATDYMYHMQFKTRDLGFMVGGSGTFSKTIDGGATWTESNIGAFNNIRSLHFPSVTTGYTANDGIFKTTDAGLNWQKLATNPGSNFTFVQFLTETYGFLGDDYGRLLKTGDGGATWDSVAACVGISLAFPTTSVGYLVGSRNANLKTTDGGATWKSFTFPYGGGGYYAASSAFIDANTGLIVTSDGTSTPPSIIYRTTDGAKTWTSVAPGNADALTDIFFVAP